jgi:hypothetical protein
MTNLSELSSSRRCTDLLVRAQQNNLAERTLPAWPRFLIRQVVDSTFIEHPVILFAAPRTV